MDLVYQEKKKKPVTDNEFTPDYKHLKWLSWTNLCTAHNPFLEKCVSRRDLSGS